MSTLPPLPKPIDTFYGEIDQTEHALFSATQMQAYATAAIAALQAKLTALEALAEVGKAMVEITTCVFGPDELGAIPEIWKMCEKERDELRDVIAAGAAPIPKDINWEPLKTWWASGNEQFESLVEIIEAMSAAPVPAPVPVRLIEAAAALISNEDHAISAGIKRDYQDGSQTWECWKELRDAVLAAAPKAP